MISARLSLFAAALLVVLQGAVAQGDFCLRAYRRCDFRFSGLSGVSTFSVRGPPDVAFTPAIFSRVEGENLGILNTNNITVEGIASATQVVPVDLLGDQNFSPTILKPFTIPDTPFSGIGHETFQGNQLSLAVTGPCVRIFFTSFQLLDSGSSNVIGNANDVPRSANKCIVFRTN